MLGRAAIIEAIKKGDIVYDPMPADLEACELISHCSIDVSLGDSFWVPKEHLRGNAINETQSGMIHITQPTADPRDYWQLITAVKGIILQPKMTILGHTVEFIGTATMSLCSRVRAKSSASGFGLEIGADAGLGDPGFSSRWALKLTNSLETPIYVPVGALIAQIYFQEVYQPPREDDAPEVLYDFHRNVSRDSWTVDCMLPKTWRLNP